MKVQIQAIFDKSTTDDQFSELIPFADTITFLEGFENTGKTYEELTTMGFNAKNKKDSSWTPSEVQLLKSACADIQARKIIPQVQDLSYYISHYIFQGTKSKT